MPSVMGQDWAMLVQVFLALALLGWLAAGSLSGVYQHLREVARQTNVAGSLSSFACRTIKLVNILFTNNSRLIH